MPITMSSNTVEYFFYRRLSFISHHTYRIINNMLYLSNETRDVLIEEPGDISTHKRCLGTGLEIYAEHEKRTVISDLASDLNFDTDKGRRKNWISKMH